MSGSGGACNTITTEPIKQVAQPSLPNVPSVSFKKYEPSTELENVNKMKKRECIQTAYPIRTLNAPNGVTRIAGAKAYAAKFAHSPRITATY